VRLAVHLLGRPRLDRPDGPAYCFRSRKSWATLAYLVLTDRPPTRSRLAALLFADAEDPLGALRWSLSEIRRGLGDVGSVDGDPVVLRLGAGVVVDTTVLTRGSWADAVALPGLGADLLDGTALHGAPAFDSWLLSEQQRLAAASEAILHEAALGSLSSGSSAAARDYAVRAAAMSPLDENHQALLIRLYRLAGEDAAAERQFAAFSRVLDDELGVPPGPAVAAAMRTARQDSGRTPSPASIAAVVESGTAAVSAGAVEAGILSLRTAVGMADRAHASDLQVRARLVLAEALIHSLRGMDEEGLAALHEADRVALASGDSDAVARARAELGYVDFLRARYDRATVWLCDALEFAGGAAATTAKATTYLGCVESDRANYPRATALLHQAITLSAAAGEPRRQAFALSMLGRVALLRGDPAAAAGHLDAAIELAEGDHWLALLPWPQALRGEVDLAFGDPVRAAGSLEHAFARACQLGDPCWEGMAARGLALVAEARGATALAFDTLLDARSRANRLADPYAWLDAYILDALCTLGRRHAHPDTPRWADTMRELASRSAMREMTVRALLHGGASGDGDAAALIAADIDNPVLHALVGRRPGEPVR
jgi:DNA-binding SARP family transcriptional activator